MEVNSNKVIQTLKINSPLQAMIRNDYLSRNPIPEIQDYLLEAKQLAENYQKTNQSTKEDGESIQKNYS